MFLIVGIITIKERQFFAGGFFLITWFFWTLNMLTQHKRYRGKNIKINIPGYIIKITFRRKKGKCLVCKNKFVFSPNGGQNRKFCRELCKVKYRYIS